MATIEMPDDRKFDINAQIKMEARVLPSIRALYAITKGNQRKIFVYVNGGLGDAICAEPAIRYATEVFNDCELTIGTRWPEIYHHLSSCAAIQKFPDGPMPLFDNFLEDFFPVKTLWESETLNSEYLTHMWTHVVDYPALAMWRTQLPMKYKTIRLRPNYLEMQKVDKLKGQILIHPGKTWKSRTVPAWWWNEVITAIRKAGVVPVLIGGDNGADNTGTVDVRADSCIDMRGKLTVMESVAACQHAAVVLTNDSAPLHMAASGYAWIGMLSTVKNPEYITHYRDGKFGFKIENLTDGGMWEDFDMLPNHERAYDYKNCTDSEMCAWLISSSYVAKWALERI